MMPKNDERRIIDSLANDKTVEMKSDDLVQMLNTELGKPENEINAQLVQEILDALEPSTPDPVQMRATWSKVKENLPKRQEKNRWPVRAAQMVASAAVICIIFVSTIEDAGAFRWTLIQRILKPVAETFGIVIDENPDDTIVETETSVYSIDDIHSEQEVYSTLAEVPDMFGENLIKPKWIPEGFEFSIGTHFSSLDSEIFSLDFVRDQAYFNLHIHINTLDSSVYFRKFERNLDIPIEMTIGPHQVTFYNNTEDREQSALWIDQNAHYLLVGELSFDEVSMIIENMK